MEAEKPEPRTVDEYIRLFSVPVREKLEKLRVLIKAEAPGAEEKISYGMPAYFLNGVLVYFAAHAAHIGVYALPTAIKKFSGELGGSVTSKGTIQFPLDEPLPAGLIRKIISFRVAENAVRKKPIRV